MTNPAPGFLPDTSCIVAAVCGWHERHADAPREIERRLDRGEVMLIAGPALIEAYSVLTRLPPPHRLSAETAGAALDRVVDAGRVITLDASEYRPFLARLIRDGIAGGQTYDAVIAACAATARAKVLLTFNARHFSLALSTGVRVVVPGERTT